MMQLKTSVTSVVKKNVLNNNHNNDVSNQIHQYHTIKCNSVAHYIRITKADGSGTSLNWSTLIFSLTTILLALAIVDPSLTSTGIGIVEGKPMNEIFPAYKARSSMVQALRDLDDYARKNARPR